MFRLCEIVVVLVLASPWPVKIVVIIIIIIVVIIIVIMHHHVLLTDHDYSIQYILLLCHTVSA